MKAKYYIPSIEEFHVGFEYELYDPDTEIDIIPYKKKLCSKEDLVLTLNNWKYYKEYRVKYLDKSDIEALGFEECFSPNKVMYGDTFNCLDVFKEYCHYILEHYIEDNHVLILVNNMETMKPFERIQLFNGNVKNKSELKRVLIMLNIL